MPVSDRTLTVPASEIRKMLNMAHGIESLIDLSIGPPDFKTSANMVDAGIGVTRDGFHGCAGLGRRRSDGFGGRLR